MSKGIVELTVYNANSLQGNLENVLHSVTKQVLAVSKGRISKQVNPAFIIWVFHQGCRWGTKSLEANPALSFSYTTSF